MFNNFVLTKFRYVYTYNMGKILYISNNKMLLLQQWAFSKEIMCLHLKQSNTKKCDRQIKSDRQTRDPFVSACLQKRHKN